MYISLGERRIKAAMPGSAMETRLTGVGLLRMIDFPTTNCSFFGFSISGGT